MCTKTVCNLCIIFPSNEMCTRILCVQFIPCRVYLPLSKKDLYILSRLRGAQVAQERGIVLYGCVKSHHIAITYGNPQDNPQDFTSHVYIRIAMSQLG